MASFVPSGDKAREVAGAGAVLRVRRRVPFVDHSFTVKSSLADARTVPSWEQATPETREAWPPLDQRELRAFAGRGHKQQRQKATIDTWLSRMDEAGGWFFMFIPSGFAANRSEK
jgi:hypothetical protein